MYRLKPGIKKDPVRRWALPDRIFFGYGACAILAGVWLEMPPLPGFRAYRILPAEGHSGNHVFVSDGEVAFDYHGYSRLDRLLAHHRRCWSHWEPGWDAAVEGVDFPLLDTAALNARRMLGPNQYLHDAIPRARRFLDDRDHARDHARAQALPGPRRGLAETLGER